jgi:hypothetical protein
MRITPDLAEADFDSVCRTEATDSCLLSYTATYFYIYCCMQLPAGIVQSVASRPNVEAVQPPNQVGTGASFRWRKAASG